MTNRKYNDGLGYKKEKKKVKLINLHAIWYPWKFLFFHFFICLGTSWVFTLYQQHCHIFSVVIVTLIMLMLFSLLIRSSKTVSFSFGNTMIFFINIDNRQRVKLQPKHAQIRIIIIIIIESNIMASSLVIWKVFILFCLLNQYMAWCFLGDEIHHQLMMMMILGVEAK